MEDVMTEYDSDVKTEDLNIRRCEDVGREDG